jgi:hypothetical protein
MTSNQDIPQSSGISELKVAAIQLHEMYMEFRGAGFTRREALYLVGIIVVEGSAKDNDERN